MSDQTPTGSPRVTARVGQVRVIVQTDSYDEVLRYLRDVLGLPEALTYDLAGDDRVTVLDVGRATIEIGTAAHAQVIDTLEATTEPAPQFRLAVETTDTTATTRALVSAGATELAPSTPTPWGSLNARVALADGVQLTLFQALDAGPETGPPATDV